jgi:hypothetical protein
VDEKVVWLLYACGIPFNVLRSPYWHDLVKKIKKAPKGYESPNYEKARIMLLDREKEKIKRAHGLQMNGGNMGYPLYRMVGQMLETNI